MKTKLNPLALNEWLGGNQLSLELGGEGLIASSLISSFNFACLSIPTPNAY